MLGISWIRRQLAKRRRVFFYRNPATGAPVYVDASIARRRLNEKCPQWDTLVTTLRNLSVPLPDPDGTLTEHRVAAADVALRELADAISFAFGAPGLDANGVGYTEAERIDILTVYLDYCRAVMEKTRPLANSPAGTDSAGDASARTNKSVLNCTSAE